MIKPIYILLLAACSMASAQIDLPDTRQAWQILDADPEVLVNAQGLAQQDLSVRGGGYTGTGISINGLRLKSPWSAHYNSEVPMLGNLLSAPTVGTGLQNISGNLVGTANFNTQPMAKSSKYAAGAGTKDHYQATAYGHSENIGGMLEWEKARKVDYDPNDYERVSASFFMQHISDNWMFDFITASQTKEFGAQGYYGAPADVYAKQKIDDGFLMASATRGDLDDAYFRATALYRNLWDRYAVPSRLFLGGVTSENTAIALEGRTMEIQNIALNLRGDLEYEQVYGYIPSEHRTRGTLQILPEARFERIVLKAGVNSVFQTSESAEFLPMAGIDWFVSDNGRFYLSYTETEQQPDYQLLYANTPFMAGNPLLEQQISKNSEIGFKHFISASCDWQIGTFFRTLENANDWFNQTGVAVATGLGTLKTAGVDGAIRYYPSEKLELRAYYQWLHKNNEIENGLYETDYPEHMLNVSAYWRFVSELAVEFAQTTRLQAENSVRTSSDFGAVASLGLHYDPRFAKNVRLSFLVDNLWSTSFQSVPGLKPRPTSIFASLAVGW
ncbi:TonB-dependent receptor [Pontiellaceae bacterium B12219]|nr:TonB-dependent receptor [Pontiellaceae bacterium B12219]